jgi:hypothetical protein
MSEKQAAASFAVAGLVLKSDFRAFACQKRKLELYFSYSLDFGGRGPAQRVPKGERDGDFETLCTQPETASEFFYLNRP